MKLRGGGHFDGETKSNWDRSPRRASGKYWYSGGSVALKSTRLHFLHGGICVHIRPPYAATSFSAPRSLSLSRALSLALSLSFFPLLCLSVSLSLSLSLFLSIPLSPARAFSVARALSLSISFYLSLSLVSISQRAVLAARKCSAVVRIYNKLQIHFQFVVDKNSSFTISTAVHVYKSVAANPHEKPRRIWSKF